MIAFDTNVLVRLLVKDDPDQFAAACAVLTAAGEARESCYLSDVVLCETAWVLASRYGASRSDLVEVFRQLLIDPRYALDDPEGVTEALEVFEKGRAELSDYLVWSRARRRGVRATYTFDRKLGRVKGCTVLAGAK